MSFEPGGVRAIHHVSLRVDDLDRAVAFYERCLGFGCIPRPDGLPGARGAWLGAGGAELHLTEHPADAVTGSAPTAPVGYASHVAFGVDDLDGVLARFPAGSVVVTGAQVFAQDPSGNVVELVGLGCGR